MRDTPDFRTFFAQKRLVLIKIPPYERGTHVLSPGAALAIDPREKENNPTGEAASLGRILGGGIPGLELEPLGSKCQLLAEKAQILRKICQN